MDDSSLNAWMAGFMDGEACLTISKQVRPNRPSVQYRPMITIANTHKGSLQIFADRYGGTLRFNKEKRKSKSGVPWSDSWTWYCPQGSVIKLLDDVEELFIVKKEQARYLRLLMLLFKTSPRTKGGRNADGSFKGSSPLSKQILDLRDQLWNQIQSLNSGKRFRTDKPQQQ